MDWSSAPLLLGTARTAGDVADLIIPLAAVLGGLWCGRRRGPRLELWACGGLWLIALCWWVPPWGFGRLPVSGSFVVLQDALTGFLFALALGVTWSMRGRIRERIGP